MWLVEDCYTKIVRTRKMRVHFTPSLGDLRKGINKGWKISFDPSLKEPKGSEKGVWMLSGE